MKYSLLALLAGSTAFAQGAPTVPASRGARRHRTHHAADTQIVRGLYVNRFAAQSTKRMRQLIQIADETEINALVIDMKDEFGLNYAPTDTALQRNAGKAGTIPQAEGAPRHAARAQDSRRRAHRRVQGLGHRARAPRVDHPQGRRLAVARQEGNAWVNPYHHELWDYNIHVAEDAVRLGFGEVQFDYIRFPEPYKSLPPQVFPDQDGPEQGTGARRFPRDGARAPLEARGRARRPMSSGS